MCSPYEDLPRCLDAQMPECPDARMPRCPGTFSDPPLAQEERQAANILLPSYLKECKGQYSPKDFLLIVRSMVSHGYLSPTSESILEAKYLSKWFCPKMTQAERTIIKRGVGNLKEIINLMISSFFPFLSFPKYSQKFPNLKKPAPAKTEIQSPTTTAKATEKINVKKILAIQITITTN